MSHRYRTREDVEDESFHRFRRGLPKRRGLLITYCPLCSKVCKERFVNVDGLNEWAYRERRYASSDGKEYPSSMSADAHECECCRDHSCQHWKK